MEDTIFAVISEVSPTDAQGPITSNVYVRADEP